MIAEDQSKLSGLAPGANTDTEAWTALARHRPISRDDGSITDLCKSLDWSPRVLVLPAPTRIHTASRREGCGAELAPWRISKIKLTFKCMLSRL